MKNKLSPLKNLFWFSDIRKMNLEENKNLIIHQTLALGDWEQSKYLFKLYPKAVIRKEFLKPRKGLYDPRVLNLCKLILGIKKLNNQDKYIKKIYE